MKTVVSKKIIHYSCEDRIEKSVKPRDAKRRSLGRIFDLWCQTVIQRDGFFYPSLTLMISSYSLGQSKGKDSIASLSRDAGAINLSCSDTPFWKKVVS